MGWGEAGDAQWCDCRSCGQYIVSHEYPEYCTFASLRRPCPLSLPPNECRLTLNRHAIISLAGSVSTTVQHRQGAGAAASATTPRFPRFRRPLRVRGWSLERKGSFSQVPGRLWQSESLSPVQYMEEAGCDPTYRMPRERREGQYVSINCSHLPAYYTTLTEKSCAPCVTYHPVPERTVQYKYCRPLTGQVGPSGHLPPHLLVA